MLLVKRSWMMGRFLVGCEMIVLSLQLELDYMDVSLRYTSQDGSWYAGIYARNVGDEDHVYAYYRTDPTIGNFANGVAIDPKIVGINFGINF